MRHPKDGDLIYAVNGAIGVVTFNRPLAHNALTFEMYDRLGEICASVPADGSLRVLIITGWPTRSGWSARLASSSDARCRRLRPSPACARAVPP